MSGYRILHRYSSNGNNEKNKRSIWSADFSPCVQSRPSKLNFHPSSSPSESFGGILRLMACNSRGTIQAFQIIDNSLMENNQKEGDDMKLDATILDMTLDHEYVPSSLAGSAPILGSCKQSIIRNHVGDSLTSGDEIIASISLDGIVRVWEREEQPPVIASDSPNNSKERIEPLHQFAVPGSTGTTITLSPPQILGDPIVAAVGCLDGSVAICVTGILVKKGSSSTEQQSKTAKLSPGTILQSIGKGDPTVMSVQWSPNGKYIAVGRKNGIVDMFSNTSSNELTGGNFTIPYHRTHRIFAHRNTVRTLAFTPASDILLTGGDDGQINAYDISAKQKEIALVGRFTGHLGWILNIKVHPEGHRFASSSSDKSVKIWDLSMTESVHTFEGHTDQVWGLSFTSLGVDSGSKLASCGDDGMIQIYSCNV